MNGAYLTQLQAGMLGLRPTLDGALVAAGLRPLKGWQGGVPEPTARRPLGVVSLAGTRTLERPFGTVTERLPVTVTLVVDEGETAALAYEGVLRSALAACHGAVASVVTDAHLTALDLVGGHSGPDPERENAVAWVVVAQMEALLQW